MAEIVQEENNKITVKDFMMAGAGSLPFLIPLELLGLGEVGLITGVVGGIAGYVWGDDILRFAKKRIPALQDQQKVGNIKKWLMERPGMVVQPEPQALLEQQRSGQQQNDDTVSFDFSAPRDNMEHLSFDRQSGKTVFSQLLATGFRPTLDRIFVGTDLKGNHLFVAAKDLCHVALAGTTGHGKSSLLRLIMAQLCYLHLPVALLNPHYMIYDKDHNEDWTPYTPYLQKDPMQCKSIDNIKVALRWMVEDLLETRKERCSRGESAGLPFFFILDEYPDIKNKIKEAPGWVGELLRQGRKYGIFLIIASQDFSVKTLGVEGEGAVRKCFLTTFYVGGDPISANELLNMRNKDVAENELGKGTIILKCTATAEPTVVHVPYLDNDALYILLGPSTYKPSQSNIVPSDMMLNVAPMSAIPQKRIAPPQQTSDLVRTLAGSVDSATLSALIAKLDARKDTSPHTDELDAIPDEFEAVQPAPIVAYQPQRKSSTALSPELEKAVQAYNQGHTSHRDLAKALGSDVTKYQAGELIKKMKERRLIQ